MQTYNDIDNDSNVKEFEIGDDYIIVVFNGGGTYLYTYSSAGQYHIEAMKKLALGHDGLNAYINKNKPEFVK